MRAFSSSVGSLITSRKLLGLVVSVFGLVTPKGLNTLSPGVVGEKSIVPIFSID